MWMKIAVEQLPELLRTHRGHNQYPAHYDPDLIDQTLALCDGIVRFSELTVMAHRLLPLAFVQSSHDNPTMVQWGSHFGVGKLPMSWNGLLSSLPSALAFMKENGLTPVLAPTPVYTRDFNGLYEPSLHVRETSCVRRVGLTVLQEDMGRSTSAEQRSEGRRSLRRFEEEIKSAGYESLKCRVLDGGVSLEQTVVINALKKMALHAEHEPEATWVAVAYALALGSRYADRILWQRGSLLRSDTNTEPAGLSCFLQVPELNRVCYHVFLRAPQSNFRMLPSAMLADAIPTVAARWPGANLDLMNGLLPYPVPYDHYKDVYANAHQYRASLAVMVKPSDWPGNDLPTPPYLFCDRDTTHLLTPDGRAM